MHKKIINILKNNKLVIIFILVIIVEASYLIPINYPSSGSFFKKFNLAAKSDLNAYAEQVIKKCSTVPYKPACYDKEIPKLMDYITMEQAFDVTKIVQKTDTEYLYCHVLGHNLSRRETEKDPSKWMDVIARCPATMCNNGCLHGSMMDRYKSESLTDDQIEQLKPDLKRVCEPRDKWHPTPIEISMCYHAIGHLNMYITNADLTKSADLCDLVGVKEDGRNYVQTCTEGVFMQIFQPLEPEDYALVKNLTPTKDKVVSFCDTFKDNFMRFEACRRESWPLFIDQLMKPISMEKWCSFSNRPYAFKTCQAAIMNMVTVNFLVNNNQPDKLYDYCSGFSTKAYQGDCFADAAARMMQIDPSYVGKSLEICSIADSRGISEECYKNVAGYGRKTYHPDTKEYIEYCGLMPGKWKKFCLENSSNI